MGTVRRNWREGNEKWKVALFDDLELSALQGSCAPHSSPVPTWDCAVLGRQAGMTHPDFMGPSPGRIPDTTDSGCFPFLV